MRLFKKGESATVEQAEFVSAEQRLINATDELTEAWREYEQEQDYGRGMVPWINWQDRGITLRVRGESHQVHP